MQQVNSQAQVAPLDISLAAQLGHEAVELFGHANFLAVPKGMLSPQQVRIQQEQEDGRDREGSRRPAAGGAVNAARERAGSRGGGTRAQSREGGGGGARAQSRGPSRDALRSRLAAQQYDGAGQYA